MSRVLKEKVAPRNCAVVVVDLQNDFCHPEGAWGRIAVDPDLDERIDAIRAFLPRARAHDVPVLFLRTLYTPWTISPAIRQWWQERGIEGLCLEGSWGAEFYRVEPENRDRIVTKYRPSGFMETDLDLTLRAKNRQTVLMAGMGGWGGLYDTARDTAAKNYTPYLLADGVAGGTPQERSMLLDLFQRFSGRVAETAQFAETWESQA